MSTNIKNHAVAAHADLHLRNARDDLMYDKYAEDGSPAEGAKPLTITLYGPGSKPYVQASAAQHNRAIERLKSKGKVNQTAQQQAEEQAEFLAAITKSFNNFDYGEGLEGAEMFKACYADKEIGFIAEQADRFARDWANFSKASPKA